MSVTVENVEEVRKKEVTKMLREFFRELSSLQEATMSWVKQYKKGRLEVYVDPSGFEEALE